MPINLGLTITHLKEVFGFDHGITTQKQMLERIFAEDEQGAKIREQLFKALEIKHFEFKCARCRVESALYIECDDC